MLHLRAIISCCERYAISLAYILLLFCTRPAYALIIDDILVSSKQGEPLLAYVPVYPEGPNEIVTPTCLSLIKTEISSDQEIPILTGARLELIGKRNVAQLIKISTSDPVNAHSIKLLLKANCVTNGLVIREFDFELAPATPSQLPRPENSPVPLEKKEVSATQIQDGNGALHKPELSGSVRAGYFSSSRKLDGEKDLATGSMWLKGTQSFGNDTALVAQGWVRNDASFRADGALEKLQEGYLKFSTENFDYRIGKQIIVWGRADRLNPTDNLTPHNYTLLTPEDDDQRIGSWAARITYYTQESSLTGIWLPDFNPNVIPIPATPGTFITEQIPSANQFALKYDRSGGNVDWSASYFNGLDLNPDLAIGATTPIGTNLILTHNRIHVLGTDAATVVGRYGLRAEAAYTWTENTGESDFVIKKPFFYMVMGGDRTFFDYLNVNAQYYLRHVANYSDPQAIADPLLRSVAIEGAVLSNQIDRFQNGVSIRVSDKWLNEMLEGEIAAVVAFGQSDYVIRPKLVYAFSDNLKGSFGLDIYRGASNTLFGLLRPNSLLYTEMKYGF